jgi:hypothetical protein
MARSKLLGSHPFNRSQHILEDDEATAGTRPKAKERLNGRQQKVVAAEQKEVTAL